MKSSPEKSLSNKAPSTRHSQKKVKDLMKALGIIPKKSMGQNFLIDSNIISKIIQQVGHTESPHFLEIGPGLGALTELLSDISQKRGGSLTLIELDRKLAEYWRSRGQKVIEADALKYSWNKLGSLKNLTVVSNLPYQISSRLVIDLSFSSPFISNMVLMFQKEVAQRISTPPRTKDYGVLTVIAQSFWETRKVVDVSPSCFYPVPHISSQVLIFQRRKLPFVLSWEFACFVKHCFAQRRKFLLKKLLLLGTSTRLDPVTRLDLVRILEEMGFSPQVRAEELGPLQFVDLFQRIYHGY